MNRARNRQILECASALSALALWVRRWRFQKRWSTLICTH